MKNILLPAILIFAAFLSNAQTDTMYIMKNGGLVNKQAINPTDLDSIIFYDPHHLEPPESSTPHDTMFMMKEGLVINKQAVKPTDLDSIVFYKPDETGQDNFISELTSAVNTLKLAAYHYSYLIDSMNVDTLNSFLGAGQLMYADPNIKEIGVYGTNEIVATYNSGLQVDFSLIELGTDGKPLTRGTGKPVDFDYPTLIQHNSDSGNEKLIGNKKVLLYSPAFDLVTDDAYFKSKVESAKPEFTVDVLYQKEANLKALERFKDYGLVVINTHGLIGSFQIYTDIKDFHVPKSIDTTRLTKDDVRYIMFANQKTILDGLFDGSLKLGITVKYGPDGVLTGHVYEYKILVTYDYIRKLPHLTDAVVFLNFCYGGNQAEGPLINNLPEAFHSIGAKSVYAFAHSDGTSSPVSDDFARAMQDSVFTNLILKEDSTGIAHLEADQYLQRDVIRRRPIYDHTFFKLYDPYEKANGISTKEFMKSLDYTFDIPRVNKDLWFHQFFDEGYKYGCGTFTDPRDGKSYQTVCIGDQVWMAENLRFEGAGTCYDGNPNSCETFGRLYTWNEITNGQSSEANPSGVQGICPEGWHVPSMDEWQELIAHAGGSSEAGRKLKANSPLWVDSDPNTDDYGFAALPAGRCDGSDCYNEDDEAIFWTSSTYGSGTPRYVFMQGIDYVGELSGNLDLKISSRCVKDE